MVTFKMPHFHFCLDLRAMVNNLSFFPQLTGKGKEHADRLPRVILAERLRMAILCFAGIFTVFRPWYLLWLQSDAELSHPCIHLASSSKTSILHLMLLSMIVASILFEQGTTLLFNLDTYKHSSLSMAMARDHC